MGQTLAIELNDSGIVVSDGEQILVDSPGYCIDQGDSLVVGKDALLQARLQPNTCRANFWSNIAVAEKQTLNRSDINAALWHLRDVWEQVQSQATAVILTVPANFASTGLGVLLGLCKELMIPVKALVHHGVLSPRQIGHQGLTMHVEMQLHHVAMTQLHEEGQEFIIADTSLLEMQGYEQLFQKLAEAIAKVFVKETRFDPLHTAQTEQQLFNSLPGWLKIAQIQKQIECQIYDGEQAYQASVEASILRKICRQHVDMVVDKVLALSPEQSPNICVAQKLDELIGFHQQAAARGVTTLLLENGHHAKLALQQSAHILDQDEQVYLIKQLPYHEVSYDAQAANQQAAIKVPSHILFKHHAYSIEQALYFSLDSSEDELRLHASSQQSAHAFLAVRHDVSGTWIESLNGKPLQLNQRPMHTSAYPSVGDQVSLEGCEDQLRFIKVNQ